MTINRVRTTDQTLTSLNQYFDTNVPDVLRQEGSVPQDLIDMFSNEQGKRYVIDTYVSYKSSVGGLRELISNDDDSKAFRVEMQDAFNETEDDVNARISAAIDDLGATFGLVRIAATKATSVERFYTASSLNGTIALTTTVRTTGLNSIEYKTTVDILNHPVSGPDTNGLYYIDVPIEAALAGTSSRVPTNRITELNPPISGFTSVTNLVPSTGGTDAETDDAFLDRISLALKGVQLDTIAGLTNIVAEQAGIIDVMVLDNKDPLVTRGIGNQVDILVIGDAITTITDTITYIADFDGEIILSKQPLSTVINVLVNSIPIVQSVDYNVVKDTEGAAGSYIATDRIVFVAGHEPAPGDTIEIEYNYNSMMGVIQSVLALPENEIPNSDILVKEAINNLVDIEMHLTLFSGYVASTVQNSILVALQGYFDALKLGDDVNASDIVAIVESISGVNHVTLPFQKLALVGQTGFYDPVVTPRNAYARLNSLTFV